MAQEMGSSVSGKEEPGILGEICGKGKIGGHTAYLHILSSHVGFERQDGIWWWENHYVNLRQAKAACINWGLLTLHIFLTA